MTIIVQYPTRENIQALLDDCKACLEYDMSDLTLDHLENAIARVVGQVEPNTELIQKEV